MKKKLVEELRVDGPAKVGKLAQLAACWISCWLLPCISASAFGRLRARHRCFHQLILYIGYSI
eukprot:SAG31_NODE_4788_length_2955_cov_8.074656_2_plen_63_part_00